MTSGLVSNGEPPDEVSFEECPIPQFRQELEQFQMNGVEIEVKAQGSRDVVELANVRVPLMWKTQQNETGMQHLLHWQRGPRLPCPPIEVT